MLEQTLSPITSRYLYSKYQLVSDNESLDKIDLRHMCENVFFYTIINIIVRLA